MDSLTQFEIKSLAGLGFALLMSGSALANGANGIDARFLETKEFALKALSHRIEVLSKEQVCVQKALNAADLKKCHQNAVQERVEVKKTMQPHLDALKKAKP